MTAKSTYRRNESVMKAGQILKFLATQKEPVAGSEVAKAVGIAPGTVMGHLATLSDLGFVRQVAGDGWELGMGLALFWARKKAMLEGDKARIERDIESLGGGN